MPVEFQSPEKEKRKREINSLDLLNSRIKSLYENHQKEQLTILKELISSYKKDTVVIRSYLKTAAETSAALYAATFAASFSADLRSGIEVVVLHCLALLCGLSLSVVPYAVVRLNYGAREASKMLPKFKVLQELEEFYKNVAQNEQKIKNFIENHLKLDVDIFPLNDFVRHIESFINQKERELEELAIDKLKSSSSDDESDAEEKLRRDEDTQKRRDGNQ